MHVIFVFPETACDLSQSSPGALQCRGAGATHPHAVTSWVSGLESSCKLFSHAVAPIRAAFRLSSRFSALRLLTPTIWHISPLTTLFYDTFPVKRRLQKGTCSRPAPTRQAETKTHLTELSNKSRLFKYCSSKADKLDLSFDQVKISETHEA